MGKPDIPLFSIEAEQSVLGALLLDADRVDDVAEGLAAKDFYDARHGKVFAAIIGLSVQGRPVDVVTVADQLRGRGELEDVGDIAYLTDLVQNTPSSVNVMRYAELVAGYARRRAAMSAGMMVVDLARQEPDVDRLVNAGMDALDALQGVDDTHVMTAPELARKTLELITQRYENPDAQYGMPTGFVDLDARYCGGFHPGDLIVVAGRPGMGKTVFGMGVADYVAREVGPVLVCSQEMSPQQLGLRQLAAASGVPLDRLQTGRLEDDDWAPLAAGVGRLSDYRMVIDFFPAAAVAKIRARARRMLRQGGLKAIVIDYLTLMDMPDGATHSLSVQAVTTGLKRLAKELGIPVILLCQLNRDVEKRGNKRPTLADLRDSGAIEQDADAVIFLYRDEYYNPDSSDKGVVEVITAKHRQGPLGTERLLFDGRCARMRTLDHSWRPQVKGEVPVYADGFD